MANGYKWRMNVVVACGSLAQSVAWKWAEAPIETVSQPAALAGGNSVHGGHDLALHGGKTIPRLKFTNCYKGGRVPGTAATQPIG